MRYALAVAIVTCAAAWSSAPARAQDYPWCAWYDWTTSNCGFTTLQQCLATVSGIGGECRPNPRYRPPREDRRRDRHRDR
jgi:hypothetical protein